MQQVLQRLTLFWLDRQFVCSDYREWDITADVSACKKCRARTSRRTVKDRGRILEAEGYVWFRLQALTRWRAEPRQTSGTPRLEEPSGREETYQGGAGEAWTYASLRAASVGEKTLELLWHNYVACKDMQNLAEKTIEEMQVVKEGEPLEGRAVLASPTMDGSGLEGIITVVRRFFKAVIWGTGRSAAKIGKATYIGINLASGG